MADPTAIARAAAQKPQGVMQGGAPPDMGPKPDMPPPPDGGGVDALVGKLQEVGEFVKAQASQGNPAAQKAMQSFQTFLQDMAALGGEGGAAPEPEAGPAGGGKVPMDKLPGVQIL